MIRGPKISVITVVRNGAQYLEETILSVIEMKKTVELDYLIIDGCSTDGTVGLIKKYSDQISYWVSEPDSGVYDAMNKGWAAAASSFILFMGAGDRLISLPENLDQYSCNDVVYGRVIMGEKVVFSPRIGWHLKLYNSLHHQALIVNKACHPAAPFSTCYRIYADFDFNQRLMKSGARFIYSPQFIAFAHPGGISDQHDFMESLKIIRKNFGILWALMATTAYAAMRVFPLLKRYRPFQEV